MKIKTPKNIEKLVEHGMGSYSMMAQPMKTPELHYTMIQFLIIFIIWIAPWAGKLRWTRLRAVIGYPGKMKLVFSIRSCRGVVSCVSALIKKKEWWKMKLCYPFWIAHRVPREKFPERQMINPGFIDQALSVKMGENWPRSSFIIVHVCWHLILVSPMVISGASTL